MTEKQPEYHQQLPAEKVENEVIFVNENFPKLPFWIDVEEESGLGLMVVPSEKDRPHEYADYMLGVRFGHGRSGDIGPVFFEDKDGRIYRDIDLKGSGLIAPRGYPISEKSRENELKGNDFWYNRNEPSKMMGLMNKEDAEHDTKQSEKFTELGIRTHRSIAIISLKSVPVGEEMVSVEKLKRLSAEERLHENDRGYLPADFEPVVQVRAYGTKTRLENIEDDHASIPEGRKQIEDAMVLVKKETGKENMNLREYLEWFSETLGKNVGIMHQNGMIHQYLTRNNITLDCRIVDLDSVVPMEDFGEEILSKKIEKDVVGGSFERGVNRGFGALDSLRLFRKRIKEIFPKEDLASEDKTEALYWENYKENNPRYNEANSTFLYGGNTIQLSKWKDEEKKKTENS